MPSDSPDYEYYAIPDFSFASGIKKDIKVAYQSFNKTSNKGTVLIPTCFGGRINKTLNFTSGALKDYHVVVVAMLGNGESSSPSNDAEFPTGDSLRYQDCINSQYLLLTQHLNVERLEAVIGFSMGGQQAYYWAAMHGSGPSPFVKRAVVICGSAKTSGHNYAFLEGPVSALMASRDYDQGTYREKGTKPTEGLRAFGRAYAAWLTSTKWFDQDLWREFGMRSLQDWLHPPLGETSWETWDPEDLIVKARMWQAGDIGALSGGGDYKAALRAITAKVLVMPCKTDQYFSAEHGREEASLLAEGIYSPIDSIWGHLAGGGANPKDVEWMDQEISLYMSRS